ncbi:sugar MFS transporter [Pseudacidobacterium ailaaui]|uniref:sugar MFS transporter n=1 Tax=Pseudacidobacterium ailaaui TaxID=1382359 RepID=UPI001EE1F6A4|nr:sugar MFS transporter [Pseudacidobacterium ailaaui]MDI3254352.1 sugar MFS transporter [Bacillota bacterium]
MSTIASPGGTNKSAMAMVTTLFFVWGFLTSLNDILIPHLKSIFSLNYAEAMLVQFAFFCSYAAFGIPSGKVVEWIGYQRTMVAGLFTMCAGALLFIPAASVPSFALFLTALIVLAAGITALQVAANPYVSVLGPSETASSRLNLTQAFNSLGTVIGPLLGGWLILRGAKVLDTSGFSPEQLRAYRIHEAATVKFPYFAIALALVVLGLAIALYRFPRIDATRDYRPMGEKKDSIWRHRHVVLGAVAIFVYVGAEVSIGSFLINYFNQPEIGGLSALAASALVPFYWGGAMVGRFIGSAILQKMQTGRLLGLCAMVASVLVVVSMLTLGHVAIWSILLVGLFNSIMFPSIFTLGIAEMGPLTGEASGLLVTAIVGGALIPEVQGVLADRIGIHHAFVLPVLCYLFIAYYGFSGSRVIAAES